MLALLLCVALSQDPAGGAAPAVAASQEDDFDLLPKELYHLAELPSTTTWDDVILISTIAIVMSSVAALIPAGRAASIDPVKALRYE